MTGQVHADYLHVVGVPRHKDTKFVFRKGLSVIRGPNGSGKSVLGGSIGTLLFSEPPIGTGKAKTAKSVVNRKGSFIELGLSAGDTKYEFKQYNPTGKTVRYQIVKNGKSLRFDRIAEARERIAKIFPLTESQFYSLYYLNVNRPHVLQHGTGPVRRQFFEDVFDQGVFDEIYRILLEDARPIKAAASILGVKKDMLSTMPEPKDLSALEVRQKALDKTFKTLSARLEDWTALSTAEHLFRTWHRKITTSSAKDVEAELAQVENLLARTRKELKAATQAHQDWEEYRATKARRASLTKKLDLLPETASVRDLEKKLRGLDDQSLELESLKGKAKSYARLRRDISSSRTDFKIARRKVQEALDMKVSTRKEAQNLVVKMESEIERRIALATKLEKLIGEHKKCPMCLSPLSRKSLTDISTQEREESNRLLKILPHLNTMSAYFVLKSELAEYADVAESLDTLDDDLEKVTARTDKLNSVLKKAVRRAKIEDRLDRLSTEKPEKPNSSIEDLDAKINVLYEREARLGVEKDLWGKLELLVSEHPQLEKLIEQPKMLLVDTANFEALKIKVRDLMERRQVVQRKLDRRTFESENYGELLAEVTDLEAKAADLPAYELLLESFGLNGIRVQQIEALATEYINSLNQYAPLLFPKPIEFSLHMDKGRLDIIATRNDGQDVSDVCLLSGAESRCFQLTTVLALLTLIPSRLRTNFLILDEMENGMREDLRAKYASQFLPQLATIVESVIVITPASEKTFYVDGATEYAIEPLPGTPYNRLVTQYPSIQSVKKKRKA